jgi:hypothetical protein
VLRALLDGEVLGHPEISGLLLEWTTGAKGESHRFGKFRTVDIHKFDVWVGEDMELRANITWLTTGRITSSP